VDFNEAATWYRQAAQQGDPMAAHILGTLYIMGQGVPKDRVQSYLWFSVAAQNQNNATGKQNALKLRELVSQGMTPAQIGEAEKLVKDWRPQEQAGGK